MDRGTWWAAVHGVVKSRTRLSNFTFTFHFHALEKEMATHSSVLAWRIPGTGEPGELLSMGSHRVGHDWSNLEAAAAAVYEPPARGIFIIATELNRTHSKLWSLPKWRWFVMIDLDIKELPQGSGKILFFRKEKISFPEKGWYLDIYDDVFGAIHLTDWMGMDLFFQWAML